jgi:hypothetical protein
LGEGILAGTVDFCTAVVDVGFVVLSCRDTLLESSLVVYNR